MLRPIQVLLALAVAGSVVAGEAAAPEPAALTQKSGVLLDRVVAVVNEGVVTQSELEEQVGVIKQRLRESGTAPPQDERTLRTQILERLIVQELQLQRAEKSNQKISDEDLNDALKRIAKSNNVAFADLPAAMASAGIDYQAYRENARKEMTMQLLQRREVQRNIRVSPRELDQFMERIKRLPDPNSEFNTSHILLALPPDATQAQVEETVRKAEELVNRATTEQFSTLAVANSNSADALEGGALGWRKGGELPSIFAEIVVGLKPGEVSKPLVDPNGIHLVKLNEVRGGVADPLVDQVHARHILLKTNELQDDGIVRLRLASTRERVLKGEDFAVFASSMSEDKNSGANGGDLDWKNPEEFTGVFAEEIAKLSDNQISEPFQTEFGWHIVQVLGRRKFDTTEDMIRERALEQLVESRQVDETELWLRRMRDEAYVEILM